MRANRRMLVLWLLLLPSCTALGDAMSLAAEVAADPAVRQAAKEAADDALLGRWPEALGGGVALAGATWVAVNRWRDRRRRARGEPTGDLARAVDEAERSAS